MKLPPGHVAGVGVVKPTAKGGLGERLLRKYGWTDGDGLGVGRAGRAAPIETKLKADNAGVGARAPSFDWGDTWWERTFDGAAKALAPHAGSSSSSSSSDDDAAAATAAPTGARHRDGTATTATAAEMKLAARLARDKWGRFGGRDGKMARIAAMEAAAADAARARLGRTAGVSSGTSVGGGEEAPPKKKKRKERTAAPPTFPQPSPPPPDAPPPYTPPPGWWGAATFKHAGRLEGLDGLKPMLRKGVGFTEADQEAAAAAGVAKGDKRGLGAAAAGRLGRGWKGTKTTFGGEDDEAGAAAAPAPVFAVKWKKLAAAALADAGKPMRLAKLIKRVMAAAVGRHGGGAGGARAAEAAEAAVRGSSKFRMGDDGRVTLK